MKDLRRDLDIQSEMRRSSAPGNSGTDSVASQQVATRDSKGASSERATSLTEPRPTRSDGESGDGSIRYRVTAMIAMLLLALAALAVWYCFH